MNLPQGSSFHKIERAGLEIIAFHPKTSEPTVDQAWRSIAGFSIDPAAKVPFTEACSHITDLWLQHSRNARIFSTDNSFLIATATAKHGEKPNWVAVKLTPNINVSSLIDDQGNIEFVARSNNGYAICGITAEEYDYWIISQEFSESDTTAEERKKKIYQQFHHLVTNGATLNDVLTYLKSTKEIPINKMHLLRLIHESCGISITESRDLATLIDQPHEPLITQEDLERKWQQLIATYLH